MLLCFLDSENHSLLIRNSILLLILFYSMYKYMVLAHESVCQSNQLQQLGTKPAEKHLSTKTRALLRKERGGGGGA